MLSLCFSFMMKTAGYSLPHAMLQALYFSSVSKKATKSHNRKQERETKIDIFTKPGEPSFQAVWLYNTVLSDVRRFKRCLCNTSTKYK